jgi:hypothetical protein
MNIYGFTSEEWSAAKIEARDILAARAKIRGMIPYSNLVAQMKSIRLDRGTKKSTYTLVGVAIHGTRFNISLNL